MKTQILFSLFVAISLAADFNITSTSLCTNVSAQGFCLRWQQSGTVREDYGSCFPAHAKVMTPNGLVRMDSLKKGDFVLGLQKGEETFTEVTSWFHHDSEKMSEYLKIKVGESHFEVSAKHNVALHDLSYIFPEEIKGEHLFGVGKIDSVETVHSQGLYSPKTVTNNYFVYLNGDSSQKVLAHCFAHIRNPQNYEIAVEAIELMWDLFGEEVTTDVHPSYDWMREIFSFLQ